MGVESAHILAIGGTRKRIHALERLLEPSGTSFGLTHKPNLEDGLAELGLRTVDLVVLDAAAVEPGRDDLLRRLDSASEGAEVVLMVPNPEVPVLDVDTSRYARLPAALDAQALLWGIESAVHRCRVSRELITLTDRLVEAHAQVRQMSLTDSLTGLSNRHGIQQELSSELETMKRSGLAMMALLVDVDDFDRVNQSLGHGVGDVVLRELVNRVRESIRPTDHVGRVGGDQFLVLLPATRYPEGRQIAERIRLALSANPLELATGPLDLTVSVALVMVRKSTLTINEIMSQAYAVLQRGKRGGKNQVAFETPETEAIDHDDNPLGAVYDALVSGDQFRALIHPIVGLSDEGTVGYELLSRLAVEGFESPATFFRLGFESNVLTIVDHGCFKTCLARTRELERGAGYHVNLLPSTLLDIPAQELLAAFPSGRPMKNYCVELSEQQIIGDPSYLQEPVKLLRSAGVRIAIDDVGFGRSCLENLVVLEPEIIKIDRKCISHVEKDPVKRDTLRKLFRISTALGAEVVAEGIETREELEVLQDMGVSFGQGFLWGEPS